MVFKRSFKSTALALVLDLVDHGESDEKAPPISGSDGRAWEPVHLAVSAFPPCSQDVESKGRERERESMNYVF